MSLTDELAALDDVTSLDTIKESESRQSPSMQQVTRQRPKIPYQPFPVNCLPKLLMEYVIGAAKSIGCDVAFVAVPMLSAIAAAIGASRIVEVKPGYTQPSILWTGVVANSGSGKSPAQQSALGPLYRIEEAAHDRHAEECERIRCTHEELNSSEKGKEKSEPDYPPLPRYCIGDTTLEALACVLKENSQGMILAVDELSGWFGSMNQYKSGKGADRSHWLSIYDGCRLVIDRKTGHVRLIIVPRAIVSVSGGIQPGVLRRLLSEDDFDSGLPARFLFVMPPDEPVGWSDTPMPSAEHYESVLQSLIDARGEPLTIPLADDARQLLADFKNEDVTRLQGIPAALRAAWSKSSGRAARLALILYSAELSAEWSIPAEVMSRAIRLARWFDRETERIYHTLGMSRSADAEAIKQLPDGRLVRWMDYTRAGTGLPKRNGR